MRKVGIDGTSRRSLETADKHSNVGGVKSQEIRRSLACRCWHNGRRDPRHVRIASAHIDNSNRSTNRIGLEPSDSGLIRMGRCDSWGYFRSKATSSG